MTQQLLPLELQAVSVQRGGRALLDRVDLEIAQETVTVVMGSNGAGKTLLLRVMHGLDSPARGAVRYAGKPIDEYIRKRQAMVFQKPVLLRRSVRANIEFVLGLTGSVDAVACELLLHDAGLEDKLDQPARHLSGGEQQRLALARALATNPEVLFLDEPTASLDPASVLRIEQAVLDAHRRGIKIIYVTHDIGQARRLADDVVFLHRGRVMEHAAASDFFDRPASEAAMAYLDGRLYV